MVYPFRLLPKRFEFPLTVSRPVRFRNSSHKILTVPQLIARVAILGPTPVTHCVTRQMAKLALRMHNFRPALESQRIISPRS
jgi:hypothetical protein